MKMRVMDLSFMSKLTKIKKRLNLASPGPWKTFDNGPWGGAGVGIKIGDNYKYWAVFGKMTDNTNIDNAFFCAHAIDDIPWLIENLETAIKYLKIAKLEFAPNTTNSDVDLFLEKFEDQ